MKKPWALTHVSASQIETFRLCNRKWYFEKVMKLPRETGRHFNFGTALHACVERHLLKEEVFPKGWYKADHLTMQEAKAVKALFVAGRDEGHLPLHLDEIPDVELNFVLAVEGGDLPWVIGFIDMLQISLLTVTDWKTAGSWKWTKTADDLYDNVQMNIYAKALRRWEIEHGRGDPESVTVQHGVFLKRPKYGEYVDGNKSRLTPKKIPSDHNERFWKEVIVESTKSMNKLAGDQPMWYDIPSPPKSSCEAFGGCSRKGICTNRQSVEEHIQENT